MTLFLPRTFPTAIWQHWLRIKILQLIFSPCCCPLRAQLLQWLLHGLPPFTREASPALTDLSVSVARVRAALGPSGNKAEAPLQTVRPCSSRSVCSRWAKGPCLPPWHLFFSWEEGSQSPSVSFPGGEGACAHLAKSV